MVVRQRFPISQLVSRTGVPPATVHHYRRLGLLPPPKRVSPNRFLYDDRHVQALRLIRTLRERRGMPLAMIRRILPDLVGLEHEQAFRPQMWDRAAGVHLGRGRMRTPAMRVLAAAREAFIRRGIADVGVDDICRAARVAKASFYRQYRSKEDLFFAVCELVAADISKSLADAAADRSLDEEEATVILHRSLEPVLPLFLDLLTRALRGSPGYRSWGGRIASGLAYEVGRHVGAGGSPGAVGAALIDRATALALRRLLEGEALEASGVHRPGARP